MGNRPSALTGEDAEVRRFNMFVPNDVREWSIHFKTTYPDGYMRETDIEKIFIVCYSHKINNSLHLKRFTKQLFNTLDITNTGRLNFNEVMIGFSILTKGSFLEKVAWLFRFYDTDKDGYVGKDEFIDSYRAIKNIVEHSRPSENDFCGDISAKNEEAKRREEETEKAVTEMTSELFADNKHRIEFKEFEEICRQNNERMKQMSIFSLM
ncbi:NCS1 [Enterospora canceri]|uniref:NCS1 n=1 Tax=Enterospora canceri TaxID=1081671 RepID=A0A1Y1S8B9_9MICR|nr:NCS1 [Enterospora canceri]